MPKIRKTDNHAFPLAVLLPKLVNRAAFLIIIPAMGNILIVADTLFLQCAIVVAPFFNVIITAFAHSSILLRLNAGSLTMVANAAIIHAPRSAAPAADGITANAKFFCSLVPYKSHDLSLLFFFSQQAADT